jgi:2-hydroxychromene-2-carboxylate isomerase
VGTVIDLADHRRTGSRAPHRQRRVRFFFDLADPGTYLAAERVERLGTAVIWQPAALGGLRPTSRDAVATRAAGLRMPLIWPDEHPRPVPRAMRAAAHAAELGRGARFVLAASRLAFCGGFDLDDPEVLLEAAAAAGVGLEEALAAAGDVGRDDAIERAARFVVAHGADRAPVLRVGRALFAGEERMGDAAAALRGTGALRSIG